MANESVFRNGIVIKNGAQNGYILMSDTNGLASWTSSSVITASSSNFANTNLTFTGNRAHNTNGNSFQITTDDGGFAAGFIYMNNTLKSEYGFGTSYTDWNATSVDHYFSGVKRLEVLSSETVFNNSGGNYDFRVEGDTDQNLLFVDASTDRVGIGTSEPAYKLSVFGTVSATDVIVSDGSVINPKFSFGNDLDTGFWRITTNTIGVAAGGATSTAFSSQGIGLIDGSITTPSLTFINDTDTGFYRSGANVITVAAAGVTSSKFTTKGIDLTDDGSLTVYGIATASNESEAVRFSQLELTNSLLPKSGYVEGASFSGSPLSYTVNFVTQFADDNSYSISVIGEDSRAWSVSNVTKTQFTIESNSSTTLTGRVRWMAQKYNDV